MVSSRQARWGPRVRFHQVELFEQPLESRFRPQHVEVGLGLESGHRGATLLVASFEKRKSFVFFADLRKASGRLNGVSAIFEFLSLFAQKPLESPTAEGGSYAFCPFGAGDRKPQSDRILEQVFVAQRAFKPE